MFHIWVTWITKIDWKKTWKKILGSKKHGDNDIYKLNNNGRPYNSISQIPSKSNSNLRN